MSRGRRRNVKRRNQRTSWTPMANGPEGLLPALTADGWDSIDWQRHEQEVRRLRSRIFNAVQEGDWPKVRNLQKLMLRSWSFLLVGVRQVTLYTTCLHDALPLA